MEHPSIFLLIVIFFIAFFLEVIWLMKKKQSFHIAVTNHLFHKVLDISEEIIQGKKGRMFCGLVVSIQTVVFLILAIDLLFRSFFHSDLDYIIGLALFIIIFTPAILLPSYWINRKTIAHCNKNFKE